MSEIIEDKDRAPLSPSLLLSISHTPIILEIINPRHSGLDQAHDLPCRKHIPKKGGLRLEAGISADIKRAGIFRLGVAGQLRLQLVKFWAD